MHDFAEITYAQSSAHFFRIFCYLQNSKTMWGFSFTPKTETPKFQMGYFDLVEMNFVFNETPPGGSLEFKRLKIIIFPELIRTGA